MNRSGQGRKPIPTPLKILEGYKDRKRINKDEPKPLGKLPRCPGYLNKEAKKEWWRMVRLLRPIGLLTEIDGKALELYCINHAEYMDCFHKVEAAGRIVESPKGYPIYNPYWSQMKRIESDIHKFLIEFGLTPSSRTRRRVEKKKK